MSRVTVTKKSEYPNHEHWAILVFDSITIPGDERSRTCPGHGYPEHEVDRMVYFAFDDPDEWEAEIIERLTGRSNPFICLMPGGKVYEPKLKIGLE